MLAGKTVDRVCHCQRGASDKVYIATIVVSQNTSSGSGLQYMVVGRSGKIYKNMRQHEKGTYSSEQEALAARDKLFASKANSKKGYIDIESGKYNGPLTKNTPWLRDYLEDSPVDPSSKISNAELKKLAIELIKEGKRIKAVNVIREKTGCTLKEAKDYAENLTKAIKKEESKTPDKSEEELKVFAGARDWEVECVNAVGLEESFDEGMTYIAERHAEEGMIYVWDRKGEKVECFEERFKNAKEGNILSKAVGLYD